MHVKILLRAQWKEKVCCCCLICFLLSDEKSHVIRYALLFDLAARRLGTKICVQVWLVPFPSSLLVHFPLYQSGPLPSWHLHKVIVERLMKIYGGLRETNKLCWDFLGLATTRSKPLWPGQEEKWEAAVAGTWKELAVTGQGYCTEAVTVGGGPQQLPTQGTAGKEPGETSQCLCLPTS